MISHKHNVVTDPVPMKGVNPMEYKGIKPTMDLKDEVKPVTNTQGQQDTGGKPYMGKMDQNSARKM